MTHIDKLSCRFLNKNPKLLRDLPLYIILKLLQYITGYNPKNIDQIIYLARVSYIIECQHNMLPNIEKYSAHKSICNLPLKFHLNTNVTCFLLFLLFVHDNTTCCLWSISTIHIKYLQPGKYILPQRFIYNFLCYYYYLFRIM